MRRFSRTVLGVLGSLTLLLLLISFFVLVTAPLPIILVGLLSDGQKNGNVPIIVHLTKPEVWSLQVLDSLTHLDVKILRSTKT